MDRLASIRLFQPLNGLTRRSLRRVPVLMYHRIGLDDGRVKHPYYRIDTHPDIFADHLRILKEEGYKSIGLTDLARLIRTAIQPGEKLVAITFDDGYRDFYTEAFPLLEQYGFSATVFLPTAYIGKRTQTFKSVDCLAWNEIQELHRANIDFGSHTVTHPQLRTLTTKDVETELRVSKEMIEHELGHAVESFSYPYAFPETDRIFKHELREILQETGYQNGVSTVVGMVHRGSDIFFMERLPVNSCDDPDFFRAKLEGAYDWIHCLQRVRKLMGGVR